MTRIISLSLTLIWLRKKVSLQLIRQTTGFRFSTKCSFIWHKRQREQQIVNKSRSGEEVSFRPSILASCVSADVPVSSKWRDTNWRCIYRRLRRNLWYSKPVCHKSIKTHFRNLKVSLAESFINIVLLNVKYSGKAWTFI